MGHRLRQVIVCLLIAIGASAVAVRVFAPQLLVLAPEGFPPAVFSEGVAHTPVPGRPGAALPSETVPLPAAAQARFAASAGRALVVEQSGVLRHAHFAGTTGPDTLLNSYSLVKSLVGVLVLRAVADGQIESLDVSVQRLLGPDAPDVPLRALLTMTSGLSLAGEPPKDEKTAPVDDASFSPFGAVARLHAFGVDAMLPRLAPDADLRGRFHYQSVNTALLGRVLEEAYGQPLERILSDRLWTPAGAQTARWRQVPATGGVSAYCCLYARAEDWVRVGRYLLNNGTPEAPFLPEALWRAWLLPDLNPEARRAGVYGWHLRHDVLDREGAAVAGPFAYMAGHKGQRVYLLPDQDMVVVRFGDAPQLLHSTLYDLF